MSYGTTIQLTVFQNVNLKGKKVDVPSYGYRIFTNFGMEGYNNTYSCIEDLLEEVDRNTIIDIIKNTHEEFYNQIITDGGFYFNDCEIDLDDYRDVEHISKDYVENYTDELFDGNKELEEEVQEILEEASKDLI